ncbi:MAG: 30S ribosomal protein S3ae [Thermoplasmatales archaeon]|nr:MAG: 30S ribosomal protein S3ae [Thermoplasmatales archaeon]
MAKARARTAARKVKDKWRAKNWYQILAPTLFDNAPVSETLSDKPDNLIGRVTEVSLQDITNDFRKAHIKLFFKIENIQDGNANTQFNGHTLTSDYLRRMIRRRKSRVDGVYDVETRDGAYLRVKPFAITEKRIQNSQKKLIRGVMKETITKEGKTKTLNEFLIDTLDGKIGSEIYKNCKKFYPVKRVEIYKTEIKRSPSIVVEEKKPPKEKEVEEPKETEKKEKKEVKKIEEKKEKPKKEPKVKEEKKTKKPAAKKEDKPKKKPVVKKEKSIKKPAKKKEDKSQKELKPAKKKEKTTSKKQKNEIK